MHKDFEVLEYILSHKRPYGGQSDEKVIAEVLDSIKGMKQDPFGNRYIHVGDAKASTLFSCHTDTVHRVSGQQKVLQRGDTLYKDDNHPLGADDGAGMWLMLQMIENELPGLYVFHRGEECGGLGSSHIASDQEFMLKPMKRAVAFDRRGTTDIITAQAGGKCASDEFAHELSKQLDLGHKPARGTFTDTANYTRIIPECTNISVGYDREHTCHETQDLKYLLKLRERVFYVDWDALPVVREPGDSGYFGWGSREKFSYGKRVDRDALLDFDPMETWGNAYYVPAPFEYDELYYLILMQPELMAQVLADKQVSQSDLDRARTKLNSSSKVVSL